ncbi:pyruvate phosphate dikinase [Anopheles sinensis]|uniref:Pyruvate phosphate dikinase n=1 Tax=Anopheles sinensis TaxID=74873 RepID=A0A084VGF0_ANOSI|nr:pyruvate phosphate dikinase [Anopheles sinensis]
MENGTLESIKLDPPHCGNHRQPVRQSSQPVRQQANRDANRCPLPARRRMEAKGSVCSVIRISESNFSALVIGFMLVSALGAARWGRPRESGRLVIPVRAELPVVLCHNWAHECIPRACRKAVCNLFI